MNFRKILLLTLAIMMLTSMCAGAKTLEFTMGSNTMYERSDGIKSFTLETAPYTKNDRTMVPVRIISESFGADVFWDGERNQVTLVKDDKTIVLTIGNEEATVNGETVVLDACPEEYNGRTMVPLRFVSETLGMGVGYVASGEQVLVTDEEAIITVNGADINIDDYKSFLAYLEYDPQLHNISEIIPQITEVLVSNYALASVIYYDGQVNYDDVSSFIDAYSDDIYKNALLAPVVQLFENEIYATAAINGYVENEVTEEVLVQKYTDEYITAKHILISSENRSKEEAKKLAQDILAKINKGEDFDTLMREYCEDPGLDYYPDGYTFTKNEMVPEFEAAAYALEAGQVSDLVETDFGYHIIKREELAKPDSMLLQGLAQEIAASVYDSMVNEAMNISDIKVNKSAEEIIALLE